MPSYLRACSAALAALASTTLPPGSTHSGSMPESPVIVFNDNGAWSFFEDERAVIDAGTGTLLVSSVANGSGRGGATRDGDVEVVQYDLATGAMQRATLADHFEADDHDSAALYVRPDGRYLAMYSRHGSDTLSIWRISVDPGDASRWMPARSLDNGAPTSYSNLYAVASENGGRGRLYNFTRTVGLDPHLQVSHDHGATFTLGGRLLDGPGRPYVRYAVDHLDRIHVFTTEQHPEDFTNGTYHGIVDHGRLLRSDGVVVDPDLSDTDAIRPERLSPVFASNGTDRAWTLDVAVDANGFAYVAYSVRSPGPSPGAPDSHRYFYARFDGTRWHVNQMAHAGSALSPRDASYTGLVALHPDEPGRVFVSTDVHPLTGTPLISRRDDRRHHELFEGLTRDGGATWSWTAITSDSTSDNLRPIVPSWDSSTTAVLWLRGTYTRYTEYDLEVVGRFLTTCSTPKAAPTGS